MTVQPANLELGSQSRFNIVESSRWYHRQVQELVEDPHPQFYFKVLFLSAIIEVRFTAAPTSDAQISPPYFAQLVQRISQNAGFDFDSTTAQLFDSDKCQMLGGVNQIRNGALLELCVNIENTNTPQKQSSRKLNPTVRSTCSKVKARRTNIGFRSQPETLPHLEPSIIKHEQIASHDHSPQEQRYVFELQAEETTKIEGDSCDLLDLSQDLEFTQKFNATMYEDYVIICLKLRSRQGIKRKFRCPFLDCRKVFNESGNLRTHIRSHTNERPYKCDHCDQTFIAKGHLDSHMLKHNGKKPFICTYPGCGKAYSRANRLKVHQRNHTGLRPFICDICDKSFTDKTNLVTHLRIHSGERPFKCSSCDKTFVKQSHLADHQKCHDSAKNFMCEVCGNSFKRKRTLNYHMTHKHSGHISLQQKCQTQQAGSDHQPSEMSFASFAEPVRRNHTVSSTRNNIISINRFSESMNPDYIIPDSERALREANLQILDEKNEDQLSMSYIEEAKQEEKVKHEFMSLDTSKCKDIISSFTIPQTTCPNTARFPSRTSLEATPIAGDYARSMSRILENQGVTDELTEFLFTNNKLIEGSQERSMATPCMNIPGLNLPLRAGGDTALQKQTVDDLSFASALQMFSSSLPSPFPNPSLRGQQTPITNNNTSLLGQTMSGESPMNKASHDSLLSALGMDFSLNSLALQHSSSQGGGIFTAPQNRAKAYMRSGSSTSQGAGGHTGTNTGLKPPFYYSLYTPDSGCSMFNRYGMMPPSSYSPLIGGLGQGFSQAVSMLAGNEKEKSEKEMGYEGSSQ